MKKILPFLFLSGICIVFFALFFFKQLLPIPSDTIIGLYNPFRDLYAKDYPNGITYKNFLITDPVRQQYPWRNISIDVEKKFQLPLWNPYNFSGSPLLANFQSAVFYPLNIFLFLMPFPIGWSLLIFLQPLLGGFFLYLYLVKMKISKFASVFGAIVFAFCGFSTAWMEWGTIMQTALWLPLILLAQEQLLKKMSVIWIIVLMFAECCLLFAGHLQTLFYAMIISNMYLIGRIFQIAYETQKNKKIIYGIKKYMPFLIIGIFIFAITAVQWIPTFQFIHFSARDVDQSMWQKEGWFIPWQHLAQFLVPDFFGNPATLNYWGVWNYGEFIGYIGILPLLFAFYALLFRRDKKTGFFGLLVFISLLFALPTGISALPFILKIPFISTAQPTRLLFVTDFSLAILAALGFDYFRKEKKKIIVPIIIMGIIFLSLWLFILLSNHLFQMSLENFSIAKHNIILPTALFIASSLVLIMVAYIKSVSSWLVQDLLKLDATRLKRFLTCASLKLRRRRASRNDRRTEIVIFGILVIITIFDLFRFAQKFTPFTDKKYLFPNTSAIAFLQQHIGNFRIMTIDSQILPPNFSIMYHLQSVDGYDPLYLKNYAQLIAASERGKPNINPPFGFNRIITPHRYESNIINLLGVKYILSLSELPQKQFKKVFQEGQTRIYKNPYVFSRAFFVKQIAITKNNQETIQKMFDSQISLRNTAIISENISLPAFSVGNAEVKSYSENAITLETKNKGEGFLVLTDVYYPTWHASVDGVEEKIIKTDYTLRGVFVPKGRHTIKFYEKLF